MMKMFQKTAIISVLLSCISIGCDEYADGDEMNEEESDMIVRQLQDKGIRILSIEPNVRLRGAFTKDAETIYFEAVRGAESQAWEFNGGDGPQYEIDVRFVDSTGRTFAAQAGGHALMNSNWGDGAELVSLVQWDDQLPAMNKVGPELAKGATGELHAGSPTQLVISSLVKPQLLAAEIVPSLSDIPYFGQMHQEWKAISSLSAIIRNEVIPNEFVEGAHIPDWDHLSTLADDSEIVRNTVDIERQPLATSCYHAAIISSKALTFRLCPSCRVLARGDHSALIGFSYCTYTGGVYYTYIGASCNHGPCFADRGMTRNCYNVWSRSYTDSINFNADQESRSDYCLSAFQARCDGGCNNNYLSPHVCNNDTLLQYHSIRRNSTLSGNSSYCKYTKFHMKGTTSGNYGKCNNL